MGEGSNPSSDKSFTFINSRVAQWKRAGPITQRSVDRNYALLRNIFFNHFFLSSFSVKKILQIQHEICASHYSKACPISAEDSALDF